jgi:hypothetical protein
MDGIVTTISAIFLFLVLALFCASIVRMLRTSRSDALRGERRDLSSLLFLVLLGLGGAFARDRFQVNSHPYWIANGLLIPICILAIWYILRLTRSYRGDTVYIPRSSPKIFKPPKLDPPTNGQGH